MNTLFFPMLSGHLVADFWLQPESWVSHKKEYGWKSGKLLLHSFIAALIPVIFTFQPELWWFVPVIFVAHYLIDILKSFVKENILFFLIDQALHIVVLWLLTEFCTDVSVSPEANTFWIYACGFILVTSPFGILVGMFLKTVIKNKNQGVKQDVSAWIGILERILIVIFVIAGQLQAIGFLVAAKSVFRFSETQQDGNQKAEYFLLGTLASFTLAILVGLGVNYLL